MVNLVGVLNVTPDSFSDGGKYLDPKAAITKAKQLLKDGATLIDVGAESTRPNALALTDKEEWARLEPVLRVLIPKYPGKISLDSYHPATVEQALSIGPVIVNDVTGFNNPDMVETVVKLKPPKVIISHHPNMGIQEAHQLAPVSKVQDVKRDLLLKAKLLEKKGLRKDQIILDPGIGFGKTMELNRQLLKFADQVPGYDVMIGYSRKRFLGEKRMEPGPNIEAGKTAISSGAKYLRVHDVAGHLDLQKASFSNNKAENLSRPKVGIGVLLIKGSSILMTIRKSSYGSGEYALPGGKLEFNESFEDCALRELSEEVGPDVKVTKPKFLCVTNLRRYLPEHYVDIGMSVEWLSGKPVTMEPTKHGTWKWYNLDDLPEPLFGCEDNYIESYKTGKVYFES